MASWDWDSIVHNLIFHAPDSPSTADVITRCWNGVTKGLTTTIGKSATGVVLEIGDLVRITPAGTTYAIIAGCTLNMVH